METAPDRFAEMFASARSAGRCALIGFFVAGDPSADESRRTVLAAAEAGLDAAIIAAPCRNPSSSTSAIVASNMRAISAGAGLDTALGIVAALRGGHPSMPVAVSIYAADLFKTMVSKTAPAVRAAGADALMTPGCPMDRSSELTPQIRRHGLRRIRIICAGERITRSKRFSAANDEIAANFLWTGLDIATSRAAEVRKLSDQPLFSGYDINSTGDACRFAGISDGVMAGTIFANAVAAGGDIAQSVAAKVREIAAALRAQGL